MSTTLTKALEFANYRITLNNQQAALKAKTESLLSYSINGGTFTVNRELISFCSIMTAAERDEIVLLDIYDNPIQVNLKEFLDEITSRYFEVTNDYYMEYEKLRKARKTQTVLDLNNGD